jgi:hypothetical protein
MLTRNHASHFHSDLVDIHDLRIKIPKWAWNAHQPPCHSSTNRATRSGSDQEPVHRLKLNLEEGTAASTSKKLVKSLDAAWLTPVPKSCKVRLWAFHYGGTKRTTKGILRHDIRYETPCLNPTCRNCLKWHPRLVRTPALPEDADATCLSFEPITPEMDRRILNGVCQAPQHQRNSVSATAEPIKTPILTPFKMSFAIDDQSPVLNGNFLSRHAPVYQDHSVFHPTALINQTISTTSTKTKWHSSSQKRYTACLNFVSCEGKQKFKELVRQREQRARKQMYNRAYRARLKEKERR